MGKAIKNGLIIQNMKVIGKKIKLQVKEYTNGKMEDLTTVTG